MTEAAKLTIEDVSENASKGIYTNANVRKRDFYEDTWVFDENKSVKWNREKLKEENEKVEAFNENVETKKFRGMDGFTSDLIEAIANELNVKSEQAEVIYNHSWEEGHSSGYSEVLYNAREMITLFKNFKEAE